jgi:hypothetical protein
MSKFISWIKALRHHFIEDCATWWKLWSTWLAALWGVIVTFFWVDPTYLQQLLNVLPADIRTKVSPFIFLVAAGLPVIVRLLKQRKLDG